jgi:2-keto-4-pentenoate hydratase/2-oxohepta-3-ene-1,7-dioic acid hydratase in catechol pathway
MTMQLRMVTLADGRDSVAVKRDGRWVPLVAAHEHIGSDRWELVRTRADDLLGLLGHTSALDQVGELVAAVSDIDFEAAFDAAPRLPFQPRSFRDHMAWEEHYIAAARGMARLELPAAVVRTVETYERVTGRVFPRLRPTGAWYEKSIYYVGNHLAVLPDGAPVPWPAYTDRLDYELELGIVITRPTVDASAGAAVDAVGGFVLVNDVSARDVQYEEMTGPFGPVKSKNFANVVGSVVVTPEEVLPHLDRGLKAEVRVNGELWGTGTTANMHHSVGDIVAYTSLGETLLPGELIATGTVPGCCGLEVDRWVRPGDTVRLELEHVGTLENDYAG